MRTVSLAVAALIIGGCSSSPRVLVEPLELEVIPGSSLAQAMEAALDIAWDETLHMANYPRPRITWYLPCAA
jgi:hypothetical protein